MKIKKIVSGGQTGADQGGLDASIAMNIPHGGFCPKGRPTEKGGKIPEKYKLIETDSSAWLPRTELNVQHSDVTIIFYYGSVNGGSLRTKHFAIKHGKPYICINPHIENHIEVIKFLNDTFQDEEIVINVAGQRESKAKDIHDRVKEIMTEVISKVNR